MKTPVRLFLFAGIAAACLCSCGSSDPLLPKSSGKAGEVIVVISRENWDGALGESVKNTLASECPWLPTKEPLYSVSNVAPGAFGDLFKAHRNIVFFDINPANSKPGVRLHHDKWASPQIVLQVVGKDSAQTDSVYRANSELIISALEQAERDRVVSSTIRYEKKGIYKAVATVFGGSPHFPTGYNLRKIDQDFAWISDDKQYTTQGVFIYRYPVDSAEPLSLESIIEHRNRILKDNVPGMFEGTYMTTSSYFPPIHKYIKYKKRQFAQVNALWEVEGDFMGGPFTSHSFYSADGKDIIVCEAWVYAPRFDKRQYLRQVESILYTWEWMEEK